MQNNVRQGLVMIVRYLWITMFFLVLFSVLGNGFCMVLFDSLMTFLQYPSFENHIPYSLGPLTVKIFSNPLSMLFPVVFVLFSVPSILVIAGKKDFSVRRYFFLLLETHGFFFLVQVLFWAVFAWFTKYHAGAVLAFLLGSSIQAFDENLTAIYMPLVLSQLMPLTAMLFVWISVRTSLVVLRDEENADEEKFNDEKKGNNGEENGNRENQFASSISETFSFVSAHVERALLILDWGNIFVLVLVLALFMPLETRNYIPHICTGLLVFFLYFIQYYCTLLYKKKKRQSLLVLGLVANGVFCLYCLLTEDFAYQLVFAGYFLTQFYALFLLARHGKGYFIK